MVEKDFEEDLHQENMDDQTDDLKKVQKQKSTSKITVNLGNEEYDVGKNEITRDIFESKDKT